MTERRSDRVASVCRRLADAPWFHATVLTVIVVNAVVVGLETYESVRARAGAVLDAFDVAVVAFFVVEIAIRLLAHARRPAEFFRRGWNVFDLSIVVLSLLPVIGANATLLRIVRVLRVARLLSAIRDLRVIVAGLARSMAPMAGVAVLTTIVMYVYAIVGWSLFGDALPHSWGTAGRSMLTIFEILTLDNWSVTFGEAQEVTPWAVPFFVSFVLLGTFVVLNIVIAVVINSVEEARRSDLADEATAVAAAADAPDLAARIAALRVALDELEAELAGPPADGGARDADRSTTG